MPPAGVVIPETSIKISHCGTLQPGWINGTHPTDAGEQVEVEVCFSYGDGYECANHYNIDITHCGSYFVYYLPKTLYCDQRYCAADSL